MIPICIHNRFHLGDALCTAHLLRSLAQSNPDCLLWFFVNANIAGQINEAIEDLPNLSLFTFESDQWRSEQHRSIDGWKNAEGHWEKSRVRWNWAEHQLEHHAWTAKRLGFQSPFSHPTHLLFDYPALNPNNIGGMYFYDVLFVNGEPCSGQFGPMKQHGSGYLNEIIAQVAKKARVITTEPVFGVECTRDTKKSITDIGNLSLMCRHHVMIATGPMWSTINTTNHHHSAGRLRVALLDNGEQLNLPNITQCATREEVVPLLRAHGLL